MLESHTFALSQGYMIEINVFFFLLKIPFFIGLYNVAFHAGLGLAYICEQICNIV